MRLQHVPEMQKGLQHTIDPSNLDVSDTKTYNTNGISTYSAYGIASYGAHGITTYNTSGIAAYNTKGIAAKLGSSSLREPCPVRKYSLWWNTAL